MGPDHTILNWACLYFARLPREGVGLGTDDVRSQLLAHARKAQTGGETYRLEDSTTVNPILVLVRNF
jgi:hypothetical protein